MRLRGIKGAVLCSCLLLAATLSAGGRPGVGGGASAYIVGVVPQFESRRLHRIWRPILDGIEQRTGYRFTLQGSPTIAAFENEFMAGAFDFAYMNPYHIMLGSKSVGYIPLVRDVGRTLHGVLVVHRDGDIERPGQLEGRVVAFPAPNALGASLQIRQELADRFGIRVRPRYVKTHDSVYLNVALGQAAAGGGVQKTLKCQPEKVRRLLRVIHTTTPVAPHPFAAHPRVAEAVRERVREALLALGRSAAGRALLAEVPVRELGPAVMADYEPLGRMGLERFYVEQQ